VNPIERYGTYAKRRRGVPPQKVVLNRSTVVQLVREAFTERD
jgi:hypothetical protein